MSPEPHVKSFDGWRYMTAGDHGMGVWITPSRELQFPVFPPFNRQRAIELCVAISAAYDLIESEGRSVH